MNNLLNLENAYNVRTIGGYKTKNNKTVTEKLFLRGDCLSKLSENDMNFLINYGLGTIIDLRSNDEIQERPNKFFDSNKIKYYNMPLIANQSNGNNNAQDLTKVLMTNARESFPKFYLEMLSKSKDCIRDIFEIIGDNLDKTILFHCTAGKDRTGVIATLLLGLVSVSTEDIISNYVFSFENNCKNPDYEEASSKIPVEVFYSLEEYIRPSIDYIENNYGSYYDYLLSTGLTAKTLDKIIDKMLA